MYNDIGISNLYKILDDYIANVDTALNQKEKDIMTILSQILLMGMQHWLWEIQKEKLIKRFSEML